MVGESIAPCRPQSLTASFRAASKCVPLRTPRSPSDAYWRLPSGFSLVQIPSLHSWLLELFHIFFCWFIYSFIKLISSHIGHILCTNDCRIFPALLYQLLSLKAFITCCTHPSGHRVWQLQRELHSDGIGPEMWLIPVVKRSNVSLGLLWSTAYSLHYSDVHPISGPILSPLSHSHTHSHTHTHTHTHTTGKLTHTKNCD